MLLGNYLQKQYKKNKLAEKEKRLKRQKFLSEAYIESNEIIIDNVYWKKITIVLYINQLRLLRHVYNMDLIHNMLQ